MSIFQRFHARITRWKALIAVQTAARNVLWDQLEPRRLLSTTYTITDLGTLGGTYSSANAINSAGQVVGVSKTSAGVLHGFSYSAGKMTDLGTLGGVKSNAYAINATGQIVGDSTTGSGVTHAFLYSAGKMTDLGTLGTVWDTSHALGINDGGQIVGSFTADTDWPHPFLYSAGTMVDLGTAGALSASATAINDQGQIVGQISSSPAHAFLYANAHMSILPTLGGAGGGAASVNSSGVIVGLDSKNSDLSINAFVYSNGSMVNIGNVSGWTFSRAQSINSLGAVVGYFAVNHQSVLDAFVYNGSIATDLNTLIPANTAWILNQANAINDQGQIAGVGTINGESHAFLLTPQTTSNVPIAPTNVLATIGTFADHIHVSWNPVAGASTYEVWRNTTNDASTATKSVTSTASTFFDDTAATTGVSYYYWVKASNASGTSAFSTSAKGSTSAPVTTGAIMVTVKTANASLLASAKVARYNSTGTLLDTKTTGAAGTVSWPTVTPGSYVLKVFASDGDFFTTKSVTVVSGVTTSTTLQQNEPFESSLQVFNGTTNVTGKPIAVGTALQFVVSVRNVTTVSQSVKANLKLLRDTLTIPDFQATSTPKTIGAGSTTTISYTFTPTTAGTFRATFNVQTLIASTYVITDSATGVLVVKTEMASLVGTAIRTGVPSIPVTIRRSDGKLIDPSMSTWIIIHGRDSSPTATNIAALATAVAAARPNDQVLTLDWRQGAHPAGSSDFRGEDWIIPVATIARTVLSKYGFVMSTLNLVGHSWGSYVADELAKGAGKVNTIVALDPPQDAPALSIGPIQGGTYNPDAAGEISFKTHSLFSWAFHSSDLGSSVTPQTASETFRAHIGPVGSVSLTDAHSRAVDLFRAMINYDTHNSGEIISTLFSLNRLTQHSYSSLWAQNAAGWDGYENVITTDITGTIPLLLQFVIKGTTTAKTIKGGTITA